MSLLESDSLSEQTTPLRSSSLPGDAYVLAIASFGSYYAASASAPSHRIFLFDKASLRTSQSFEGHQGGTTSLRAVDSVAGINKRGIISSGRDGVVRVWDVRTSAPAIESACSSGSGVPAQNKGVVLAAHNRHIMTSLSATQRRRPSSPFLRRVIRWLDSRRWNRIPTGRCPHRVLVRFHPSHTAIPKRPSADPY
jgi:WD40 repeat protein